MAQEDMNFNRGKAWLGGMAGGPTPAFAHSGGEAGISLGPRPKGTAVAPGVPTIPLNLSAPPLHG